MAIKAPVIEKYHFYTTLLVVISMPFFMRFQIYSVALWGFTALLNYRIIISRLKQFSEQTPFTKLLIFLIFVFILSIIYGAFISENQTRAWNFVVRMLLFFWAPFLFLGLPKEQVNYRLFVKVFVLTNLLAVILLISHAVYNAFYIHNGEDWYFYMSYIRLAVFIHSSYSAMFAVFSVVIILYLKFIIKEDKGLFSKYYFVIPVIFIFSGFIFLLSSKINMLALVVAGILFLLKLLFQNRAFLILKLVGIFLFLGISAFVLMENQRFSMQIEALKNAKEQTPLRLAIWKETYLLIEKYQIKGLGIGDVQAELTKNIHAKYRGAVHNDKNFNAHNQFLEVWLGMGIVGFLSFTGLFFMLMYKSIRDKNYLFLNFLILLFLNLLVESMLVRFSGVLFFTFFAGYFMFESSLTKTEIKD